MLIRILAFQLVIGVVPLLFFGLASMFSINSVLKNEAIDFQKDNVKQGALYINLVMNDVESLVASLSGNDEVNNALSGNSSETAYSKLTTQAKIGSVLSGYTNLKGLVSIDLFSSDNTHYHVGETLSATNINEPIVMKLIAETQRFEGFVYWSGIEDNINLDSEYPTVITATKILNPRGDFSISGDSSGLLVVSYDPAVFDEGFGQTTDETSYTIILDAKNRILFHPNAQFIGQIISDALSTQISAQTKGSFSQIINGENMLVIFDSTQKGDWTVTRFIPLKNILSNGNTMTAVFIILIIVSISVTAAFGLLMSKQLIQPIKKITDTFRSLQSGDFTNVSKLKFMHQDEIGELGNLFNSFIDAREDITTQKKLERQLNKQNQELQQALQTLKTAQAAMVQQEKMAGIGVLASGVAHEINNPLGFVTSNFSVLNKYIARVERMFEALDAFRHSEKYLAEKIHQPIDQAWGENSIDATRSDLTEIISDTQEGLKRIAEIVNALKMFSRTSLLEERSLYDLNEGIRTTLLIANNEIKYNSTVQFNQVALPEIYAHGGQINQVLLNILVNAAQAIKQKKSTEKGIIKIDTCVESDYICCKIEDNGCGMTEDVMKRIFEPFYTTKVVGQGTGLGLSLAYDIIVNKHNGKLEVTSQYGVGTCFRIIIPINQAKAKDE